LITLNINKRIRKIPNQVIRQIHQTHKESLF